MRAAGPTEGNRQTNEMKINRNSSKDLLGAYEGCSISSRPNQEGKRISRRNALGGM